MTKLEKIIKEISELKERISVLNKEKIHEMGIRLIKCEECGRKSQAKKFPVLEEIKWDNQPYSECTYVANVYLMCPKCKETLYVRDKEFMNDYKFGEVFEYEEKYHYSNTNSSIEKAMKWIDDYDYNQLSERDKLKKSLADLGVKNTNKKRIPTVTL